MTLVWWTANFGMNAANLKHDRFVKLFWLLVLIPLGL